MLESEIQHKIIKYLKNLGAIAVKVDASRPGWPDLTVVMPDGTVLFLEVKQEGGRLRPAQKRIHDELRANHAHIHIVRSVEDVELILCRLNAQATGGH